MNPGVSQKKMKNQFAHLKKFSDEHKAPEWIEINIGPEWVEPNLRED